MNINDVLIRILKKDDQISEQILHRNEKHVLENIAREARDREMAERIQVELNSEDSEKRRAQENTGREIAEKFQEEGDSRKRALENSEAQDREIPKPEQLKQVEMPVTVNSQTEVKRWRSDELKKIEKETKDRKSELERLRALAACELEEANRSMKAAKEEIAQLKQALAAKEDNQRSNEIQARSSEKKSSRHWHWQPEPEEDEELEGNFIENLKEASSKKEEERPSPASPPSSRKSPKVECKPQTSSAWGTLPHNVDSDDSTAQFRGGLGRSESSSRSGSGQSLLSDVWFFLTSLRALRLCQWI
jgi:hypothetical protein